MKVRQARRLQMKTMQGEGLAKQGREFGEDRHGKFGSKASQVEDRGKE
jgi:hypothetical protein